MVILLQVWRVEWNVTGTILASSGDDGCVRLWKGMKSFKKHCNSSEKLPWEGNRKRLHIQFVLFTHCKSCVCKRSTNQIKNFGLCSLNEPKIPFKNSRHLAPLPKNGRMDGLNT